ncbi:MAG: universal stress protein [Lentimicrobiaceae bacterium]|nr:universal stress protein [Lentimicrobiaceae bacterium]
MKDIIVAIDFSDCSINALEHAISIANKTHLNINMVWVNNPNVTKIEIFSGKSDELISEVQKQFGLLIKKYKSQLGKSTIDFKIREGKVYREIVMEAKESEATLIVAGTHGASGFEEFWIGSNANKIVSAAPCPVITIRAGRSIRRNLEKIILPIDNTLETRQKVPFTVSLASYFDAEIHVLSVLTSKVDELRSRVLLYSSQVMKHLEKEGIKGVGVQVEADNITTAIIEYAEKVDANLISIMSEQEKSMSNLLMGTYAQQMVNRSPIPVLILHSQELLMVTSM